MTVPARLVDRGHAITVNRAEHQDAATVRFSGGGAHRRPRFVAAGISLATTARPSSPTAVVERLDT
jgi:hypothetical protein